MESVIEVFYEAGVDEVVILATYPIFAGKAADRLINKEGVTIVTTDGYTPQNNLSHANNLINVPMVGSLKGVLELDERGIDYRCSFTVVWCWICWSSTKLPGGCCW